MNIPSVKTIRTRLNWLDKVGDPLELAKKVRKELEWFNRNSQGRAAHLPALMAHLNKLLCTQGVEYAAHTDDDQHGQHGIYYLNTGDSYTTTICYNYLTRSFQITSCGDIVERRMNDYD